MKIFPDQGTSHFCLLNVAKRPPKLIGSKEEARGEGNEAKFKKKLEEKNKNFR